MGRHGRGFPARTIEPSRSTTPSDERKAHALLVEYTALRQQTPRREDARRERFATEFVLKLLKKRLFSSPRAFDDTLAAHLALAAKAARAARPSP